MWGLSQTSGVDGRSGMAVDFTLRCRGDLMILSAIAERLKRRSKDDFKSRHFEAPLIVQAVSWYLRYSPSLGQLSSIRSCIGMR